jgi:hypothetical protein
MTPETPDDRELAARIRRRLVSARRSPSWLRVSAGVAAIASAVIIITAGLITAGLAALGYGGPAVPLETPDASLPTAGACAGLISGDVVTVELMQDTPAPRCIVVTASQQLRLVNGTDRSITIMFHGTATELSAGSELTYSLPLGSVWQPGVHLVRTSAYSGSGVEVWLR